MWRNLLNGVEMPAELNSGWMAAGDAANLALQIRNNRDYYQFSASFNGTSGVGRGTLAARPSTCTTGVGYWATDQGEWNSNSAGPDGQLYKCTATNTWSLYYIPYPYPHPLRSGGPLPSPGPPNNLRIIR